MIYWKNKNEAGMGGIRGKLEEGLAAGDRWSERMNRDADSRTQLSAGSQRERERLTPTQGEREAEGWQTERLFQIAAGLTVCTQLFRWRSAVPSLVFL